MQIGTERLTLDPLTIEDAAEMVDVLAGEALYSFIGGSPPNLEQLQSLFRRLAVGHSADGSETWHNWIARRRSDRQPIGTLQATVVDDGLRADIAWVIGLAWQGQGFASEAAQGLVAWLEARGVATITAHVHPGHHASAAVAAKAGLQPTDEIEDGERVWRRVVAGNRT